MQVLKKHTLQALHEIVWLSLEAPQTFLKHNQTLTFEQGLAHAREICNGSNYRFPDLTSENRCYVAELL